MRLPAGTGFPVELVSGVPVVAAPEEIDITNAPDLRSALVEAAAGGIDADPADRESGGRLRALGLRALVEATATGVMHRVGRARGRPAEQDEAHSRRSLTSPCTGGSITPNAT
jgi:hypothetical protein